MSFFWRWLRRRPLEEQSSEKLCRLVDSCLKDPASLRPERAQAKERARRAMLILAGRPYSDRIFQLAANAASLGPLSSQARHVLGQIGRPNAIEALLRLPRNNNTTNIGEKEIIAALGQPRNAAAIPDLLQMALETPNYMLVRRATQTLAAMGGAEAEKALATFRASPSRRLSVVYLESPEPVYTSRLGQAPTDEELREALSEMRLPPFIFGDEAAATAEFEALVASPTLKRAMAFESFLLKSPDQVHDSILIAPPDHPRCRAETKITAYPSIVTDEAARAIVRASQRGLAARKAKFFALLTPDARARIEAHLGHPLPAP